MKMIDAHMHVVQYIAGTGAGGELRSVGNGMAAYADGQVFQMIPPRFGEQVTAEQLLEVMDANGVEKGVLLQGNYYGFQNLYTYEAVKKYPDRFAGAASYDPYSRNAEKIKRHLFEELGFRIVKFEVSTGSGLMCNHPVIPLNGEVMDEAYSYARDHGHVFVIDIGKCGSDSWQVENLRDAVLRYPDMKFVVCHLLAPSDRQEEELKWGLRQLNLPNVWFDLASTPHNCRPGGDPYGCALRYLLAARDIVGADRLMFGTDLPSALNEDEYHCYIDYIADSRELTGAEKEHILGGTAQEVYFTV